MEFPLSENTLLLQTKCLLLVYGYLSSRDVFLLASPTGEKGQPLTTKVTVRLMMLPTVQHDRRAPPPSPPTVSVAFSRLAASVVNAGVHYIGAI